MDFRWLIAGSWLGFFVLAELLFPIWLGLAIVQFVYDRRRGWLTLLFSAYSLIPLVVALLAFGGYFTGQARFLEGGLMRHPYQLHPEYRCEVGSIGCVGLGYLWTALPNNLVIQGMTSLCGPVRRTYHGPYPTEGEAFATVDESGFSNTQIQFETGSVDISDGRSIPVDRDLIPSRWCVFEGEEIRAALFREECLLLDVRNSDASEVLLVDRSTGKPFARYHRSIEYAAPEEPRPPISQ